MSMKKAVLLHAEEKSPNFQYCQPFISGLRSSIAADRMTASRGLCRASKSAPISNLGQELEALSRIPFHELGPIHQREAQGRPTLLTEARRNGGHTRQMGISSTPKMAILKPKSSGSFQPIY